MTHISRLLFSALIAFAVAAPLQAAHARGPYAQAELDQMLAPIALYPDALLAQVFFAATRPQELAEAAEWLRANPGLQGDDAVHAAQHQPWDPSVQALVAFPPLVARMAENPEWTQALGEAFFVQEPLVMETVQALRRRARAAGHLAPDGRLHVYEDGPAIVIEPASPQIVYVPYYDPWIVYGPWWWSSYPPFAWAPWPGYALVRRPGVTSGFWWGTGFRVSTGFRTGGVDWSQRRVRAPSHWPHSRPATLHRDPAPQRRIAPESVAPAPRVESHSSHPERPYVRRDGGVMMTPAEPRRTETRTGPVIESSPRFRQRAADARQLTPVAPAPVERSARAEPQRIEQVPQPQAVQPQRIEPVPQPHAVHPRRIERVPQPQAVQPPRIERVPQAQAAQPPRIEQVPQAQAAQRPRIERVPQTQAVAQPQPVQAPQATPPRAAPAPHPAHHHAEQRTSAKEMRDTREGLRRDMARP